MLTPKQRRFVEALLTNPTVKAAAAAAGISEKTGHAYVRNPEVKAAIKESQADALRLAATAAAGLSADALEALKAIVRHGEADRDKVQAARILLTYGLTVNEQVTLEERIAELEGLLNDKH